MIEQKLVEFYFIYLIASVNAQWGWEPLWRHQSGLIYDRFPSVRTLNRWFPRPSLHARWRWWTWVDSSASNTRRGDMRESVVSTIHDGGALEEVNEDATWVRTYRRSINEDGNLMDRWRYLLYPWRWHYGVMWHLFYHGGWKTLNCEYELHFYLCVNLKVHMIV